MADGPNQPSLALKAATVLFFLVGLAGVTGAVYELGSARRAWASLKAARADYAAEQAKSQIITRTANARDKQVDTLKQAAAADQNSLVAQDTSSPGGDGASGWDQKAEAQLFLNAFPQARGQLASLLKLEFKTIFGPFLRTANLTQGQVDLLEAAITDNWQNNLTLGPKGQLGSGAAALPTAQLQSILGNQEAQALQDYERAMPAQQVANKIATANGYAGTPLSADQTAQLTQLLAHASSSYEEGKNANMSNVNWTVADAQAQATLSPQQAQLASNVFAKLQYEQALRAARQAVRAAAGK